MGRNVEYLPVLSLGSKSDHLQSRVFTWGLCDCTNTDTIGGWGCIHSVRIEPLWLPSKTEHKVLWSIITWISAGEPRI